MLRSKPAIRACSIPAYAPGWGPAPGVVDGRAAEVERRNVAYNERGACSGAW